MKIKKKIRVSTTQTAAVTIFSVVVGIVVAAGFGPAAGLLTGIAGAVVGIYGAKSEAREKANKLLPDDELLKQAKETYKKIGKR